MKTDEYGGDWLKRVLAVEPDNIFLDVAGARLSLLTWGDRNRPALLFIHGGAAHSGWWRFIAPYFLPDYYCVAVDLSGHGHSSHRKTYPQGIWATEITGLISCREVFSKAPVLIGHSMGGLTSIRVAAETALPGLIVIDAAVRPEQPNTKRRPAKNLLGRERLYSSREDALKRFRLIPPQPVSHPELVAYIAANSLRQVADGWTWLFDPRAFKDLKRVSLYELLSQIHAPNALVRGQYSSILDDTTAADMCRELGGDSISVVIPEAHHHVLLDQPRALVSSLRTILSSWSLAAE